MSDLQTARGVGSQSMLAFLSVTELAGFGYLEQQVGLILSCKRDSGLGCFPRDTLPACPTSDETGYSLETRPSQPCYLWIPSCLKGSFFEFEWSLLNSCCREMN